METISERDNLVNKLVQKLSTEYETERNQFLQTLQFSDVQIAHTKDSELNYYVDYIAFKAGLLAWVKQYLIDMNGAVFRAFRSCDSSGNAIFYVDTDCIQILLEAENTISHIASRFRFKLTGLYELFQLDETNIDHMLVSAIEYAAYRNNSRKDEQLYD